MADTPLSPKTNDRVKRSRRTFLKLLAGSAAASMLGGGTVWADSYNFTVSQQTRTVPGLRQPLRVAQLSDLHFGRFIGERSIKKWIDATLGQRLDMIIITGDFYDGTAGDPAPLLRQLARLDAPLGVYGVWGNHDYDLGLVYQQTFQAGLEAANIQILKNTGLELRDDIYLAGTDDLWNGQPDIAQALAGRTANRACLLMTHIPDMLPHIPAEVDQIFCGHTHGGQIKLPFFGAVVTASEYGTRYLEGWVEERAFVSRGLGMVLLPLRFMSRSQIVVHTLLPDA